MHTPPHAGPTPAPPDVRTARAARCWISLVAGPLPQLTPATADLLVPELRVSAVAVAVGHGSLSSTAELRAGAGVREIGIDDAVVDGDFDGIAHHG